MKRYKKGLILTVIVVSGLGLLGAGGDLYKINKSFDIFGAVFREVSANYVLDIDPETLVTYGIDGMLSSLDPYTEFYNEDDVDELDYLTNGTYTGLGFTLASIDSQLTVVDVREGYAAQESGIRRGDRIYSIDGVVTLYDSPDELKYLTSGPAGEAVKVAALREGRSDTLFFVLSRNLIKINDVPYYDIMPNGIGYIKLERFSRSSLEEFRNALANLKSRGKLNGLIIDLQDNPGGLLDAAVSIAEIFVPKDSPIVSTRGKNPDDAFIYRSDVEPTEPNIPLVTLINENSASASEILAGALQDLDRSLILGNRSFGKGLVQTVIALPYRNNLKITTAKYYTPSGRCIQKLEFAQNYDKRQVKPSTDTTVFYTRKGRKVYELTGILPDSIVLENENYSELLEDLASKNMFMKFAAYYFASKRELPANFKVTPAIYSDFVDYLKTKNYTFKSSPKYVANYLDSLLTNKSYYKNISGSMKKVKSAIDKEDREMYANRREEISQFLEFEIKSLFLSNKQLSKEATAHSRVVTSAVSILEQRSIYDRILAIKPGKNDN